MKTTRPNSVARAKELGENKGVAANGLTNTNTDEIIPTIRWSTLMTSLGDGRDCPFSFSSDGPHSTEFRSHQEQGQHPTETGDDF
jgi:hypothetical protein